MTKREDVEKVTSEEDAPAEEKPARKRLPEVSSDGWEVPDFFADDKANSDESPAPAPPERPAEAVEAEEPRAEAEAPTEETFDTDAEVVEEEPEMTPSVEPAESAPQLAAQDDEGPPLHRWFLVAALATIIVVLGIIMVTKAWQPYACTTTFGPFVELIKDQPEELPRWLPSDDCRGQKQCIYGLCRSEEVWFRTNWVNRMKTILHGVD